LAGAAGWADSELANRSATGRGVDLVSAVSRTYARKILGGVSQDHRLVAPNFREAKQALRVVTAIVLLTIPSQIV
jgi:hypothetical protein